MFHRGKGLPEVKQLISGRARFESRSCLTKTMCPYLPFHIHACDTDLGQRLAKNGKEINETAEGKHAQQVLAFVYFAKMASSTH